MAGIVNVTGHLLKGALIGGIAALVGGFVLLGIVGVIGYGLGGVLMGVYFGGLVIFYVCPVGMFIGAVVAMLRAVRRGEARLNIASIMWVGLLLLVLAVVVYIPHHFLGEKRNITHAATWIISQEEHGECETDVAILILVEYAHYEEVCSEGFLTYLETETREILPITYTVTYNFGEPSGRELIRAGSFQIRSYPEWIGGKSGCGSEYLPPCDSPQAQNESMLYESTWEESTEN